MNIDKCREAFEAWVIANGVSPELAPNHTWREWQAAWTACEASMATSDAQDGIEARARAMFEAQADKLATPWERQWELTKQYWRNVASRDAAAAERDAEIRCLDEFLLMASEPIGQQCCGQGNSQYGCCGNAEPVFATPNEVFQAMQFRLDALTAQQQENKQ